jgi:hypothetical protein
MFLAPRSLDRSEKTTKFSSVPIIDAQAHLFPHLFLARWERTTFHEETHLAFLMALEKTCSFTSIRHRCTSPPFSSPFSGTPVLDDVP